MHKRAIIFVNGQIRSPEAVRAMITPLDDLIAADRGLEHMLALGLTPDLLVGDLDSVAPADLRAAREKGVRIERYPTEKNETDLELALKFALQRGADTIRIVGAAGGRLDMMLSHVLLLTGPQLRGLDVRLDDGCEQVFLITGEARIEGKAGDRVSLLAVSGPAEGVVTEGLYYPLKDETLLPEQGRGLSNRMMGTEAKVRLRRGQLICLHTRLPGDEEGDCDV